jgi:hypothetical protein
MSNAQLAKTKHSVKAHTAYRLHKNTTQTLHVNNSKCNTTLLQTKHPTNILNSATLAQKGHITEM